MKGRGVISEVLAVTPRLAQMISDNCPGTELARAAAEGGFVDMQVDARVGVQEGRYAEGEVLRVLGEQ